jgi:hypothetical protein
VKGKTSKRPARVNPPPIQPKPLRELWERLPDSDARSTFTLRVGSTFSPIEGVSLPPDLGNALNFFSREETFLLVSYLSNPPALPTEHNEPEGDWDHVFEPVELEDVHVSEIQSAMKRALRIGFNLAVLRYADDLKHVPEAAAMLTANRKNAKKGGAARHKQAEPRRQEARRLDRELRKTVKKKYLRVQRIAAEMKVDTRTVERYLAPKK